MAVSIGWIRKKDIKGKIWICCHKEGKGGPGWEQVQLEWNSENLFKCSNQTDEWDVLKSKERLRWAEQSNVAKEVGRFASFWVNCWSSRRHHNSSKEPKQPFWKCLLHTCDYFLFLKGVHLSCFKNSFTISPTDREHIDTKLIRTATTLDLNQKAKKQLWLFFDC